MRLFVAVPLPDPVRRRLAAAVTAAGADDAAVRWVPAHQLHVTVKFLGQVAPEREPAIIAALDHACAGARAFAVAVERFGAFPPVGAPRVLWAGLEPAPPLELLQDAIERAMADLGFPIEGRPFRPHVTVGRVRRGRRVDALAERLVAAEHADTVLIDRVELMDSRTAAGGPAYRVRHTVALEA